MSAKSTDTIKPHTNSAKSAWKRTTSTTKGGTQASGKKPLGQKEIIPFEWKLVGEADGFYLTLFKAIELEEVEAQLERVSREGYYKNLKILDNNAKIVQSKSALKAKKAVSVDKKKTKAAKNAKFGKSSNKISIVKITIKPSVRKKSRAASKKTKKTKTPAKKAAKKTVKSTKKKKAPKKTTKPVKRTSKSVGSAKKKKKVKIKAKKKKK